MPAVCYSDKAMSSEKSGTIQDFGFLTAAAIEVSKITSGKVVSEQRYEYASYIFTNICLICDAVLRIHPESGFYCHIADQSICNLPAIAALSRVLMEATVNLYYFGVEEIPMYEREARFLRAELHEIVERCAMVSAIRSSKAYCNKLADGDCRRKDYYDNKCVKCLSVGRQLLQNKYFLQLQSSQQKDILKKNASSLLSRRDMYIRAGISESNTIGDYRYFSAYTHSSKFAMGQIAANVNDLSAINPVEISIRSCCGYLALAINHYCNIFPNAREVLSDGILGIIASCVIFATEPSDDKGL
jgi:hypothetical protein